MAGQAAQAVEIARGKALVIGVSAIMSVGYCLVGLRYIPGNQTPDVGFWLTCGGLIVVMIVGTTDWPSNEFVRGFVWFEMNLTTQRRISSATVYLLTLLYVVLLGWICLYTGGPIKSPYAIILLTVAVLSPFATEKDSYVPMILVLITVAVTYFGSWAVYRYLDWAPPRVPDALVAITSFVSVVISVVTEVGRRLATRRALGRTASAG